MTHSSLINVGTTRTSPSLGYDQRWYTYRNIEAPNAAHVGKHYLQYLLRNKSRRKFSPPPAAPTISIDRLLMVVFGKPENWNADFDDDTQLKEE